MEEGIAKQLKVQDRMIEAVVAQGDDPGWSVIVLTTGLQVIYTWIHKSGNLYTVEASVSWATLANAPKNPLLVVMDDLIKQKMEWKP